MKINMTERDAYEVFTRIVREAGEYAGGVRVPVLNRSMRDVWGIVVEALGLEFEAAPAKRPLAARLVLGVGKHILVDEDSGRSATPTEYLEAAIWYNTSKRLRDVLYGDPRLGLIVEIAQEERDRLLKPPRTASEHVDGPE